MISPDFQVWLSSAYVPGVKVIGSGLPFIEREASLHQPGMRRKREKGFDGILDIVRVIFPSQG